ncbi:glycosyltransferase family 4 protein [Sphingomonas sp. PAMC 26617]|uniref:glycosyltransferase family 4 protein n=1 Tax=Sphingomonas sp. PAMC 26617 TaxID=1112216 RepID=UPI0002DFD0AE|nr:glycosyltransferase family 4 protein [Sphingomonas sp. PAMC 26617]
MRVFVHLAFGFGDENWARRYDAGALIGINDRDAYGYRRAEAMGATLETSRDHREGRLGRLVRLGFRWLLGFDLLHAVRNRRRAFTAEVIWTHTESQFLAFCLLFAVLKRGRDRPKLIAQSVWLIDHWDRQPVLRRMLWRRLIREADVLTFHSPDNLARARTMFPEKRCEMVLYGIRADDRYPRDPQRRFGVPLRLLAVGNDTERDWPCLVEAVRDLPSCRLRIVSTTCPPSLADGIANVEIAGVASNDALKTLYHDADIALLPLKENSHASGCTVAEEAALFGLPLIVSDTGGLRAYFAPDAVRYTPPGDAPALRQAILDLGTNPAAALEMAQRAQARMGNDGLSAHSFVRHHVLLSRALLDRIPAPAQAVAA